MTGLCKHYYECRKGNGVYIRRYEKSTAMFLWVSGKWDSIQLIGDTDPEVLRRREAERQLKDEYLNMVKAACQNVVRAPFPGYFFAMGRGNGKSIVSRMMEKIIEEEE